MISPHTAPGTTLSVVWAEKLPWLLVVVRPEYRGAMVGLAKPGSNLGISVGERYVLAEIRPNPWMLSGFCAILQGKEGGYPLECFEVAQLPGWLTELLVPTKVPEDA